MLCSPPCDLLERSRGDTGGSARGSCHAAVEDMTGERLSSRAAPPACHQGGVSAWRLGLLQLLRCLWCG